MFSSTATPSPPTCAEGCRCAKPVMLHKQSWDRVDVRRKTPPAGGPWYRAQYVVSPGGLELLHRGNEDLYFFFPPCCVSPRIPALGRSIIIISGNPVIKLPKGGVAERDTGEKKLCGSVTGDMGVRGQRHGARDDDERSNDCGSIGSPSVVCRGPAHLFCERSLLHVWR